MFLKLRNKFILFNAGISAIVITIVFSVIYISATGAATQRPPMDQPSERDPSSSYTKDIEIIIESSIKTERASASKELLSILIFSGLAIEIYVIIISYFLADIAIKPVKDAYESQRTFIANASHEIKTPLAAISANLEAADIKNNKWIQNVEEEAKKITSLNNKLLKLAKNDTTVISKKIEQTDLKKLTKKELDAFIPRLESNPKKITLKQTLNPSVKNLNREDFCEVLNILLDNALKYCDSKIEVSLSESEVTIKNDGKLIPKEKLPHIFDRFYQIDKSMDGAGLGLSIAMSIAECNHWKLSAKTSGGLNVFTLTI